MNSILLVNGNTDDLIETSSLLTKRGYEVIAKTDGASALAVLQNGPDVDLVVADYVLPDMEAVSFFTSMKRAAGSSQPLVILLSDRVDVKNYLTALHLGAFEFLFRPVDPREFVRIVNVAVKRRVEQNVPAVRGPETMPELFNGASLS